MAGGVKVFWVDAEYDREHASDGVSRYAAYAADRKASFQEIFAEDYDSADRWAVEFAAQAWSVACPPVMSPGLVASHPRVLGSRAAWDDWAGDLLLTVDLVSALPEPVDRATGWSWQGWEHSVTFGFSQPQLHRDSPRHPTRGVKDHALLPVLTVVVQVLPSLMPTVNPTSWNWRTATDAVHRICDVLNDELGPIVTALDGDQ